MYIQKLKRKYKQILNPDIPTRQTYFNESINPMMSTKNDRVLTEHTQNSTKSIQSTSTVYVLALKERIAQLTHNIQEKEKESLDYKEQIYRKEQQIKMLEYQLSEQKEKNQVGQQRLIEEKILSNSLQKELSKLKERIEAFSLEKDLTIKQSEYYKSQISKMNKEKHNQLKIMDSVNKTLYQIEETKTQNARLKTDVKRLQTIINEMCQERLKTDVSQKHYLGKPLKQASMWFSQNLVGEVQHFLKKEQVGQGSKKFLNNLVKFISKYVNTISKSKQASSHNSRVRSSAKSSHIRSSSVCDPGYSSCLNDFGSELIKKTENSVASSLKKSLLVSKYKKIDSRKYTASSLLQPEKDVQGSQCQQILGEYRRILKQALKEKSIKSKVILELTDEMSSTILRLFQDNGAN